jgi:CxxC motif-containing protein (DUF1111 family)
MKLLKFFVLLLFAAVVVLPVGKTNTVESQALPSEAPTGFDNQTIDENFVSQKDHDFDREDFEEREIIPDGLGPVYNAQSCAECHQNPVTGGISQITELRAGHRDADGNFVAATAIIRDEDGQEVKIPLRSLINDRAICPAVLKFEELDFNHPHAQAQEHVPDEDDIRSFRTSLNLLGDGFVEAIGDDTIKNIADGQPGQSGGQIRGQVIEVLVLEASQGPVRNVVRVGRFGWKNQHASLLSFSSDAYINEMGITNNLRPNDVDVTPICDEVKDPEDVKSPDTGLFGIEGFARFMRASKAPSRDKILASSDDAQKGAKIFDTPANGGIGCAICHVTTIVTLPPGTLINGGTFVVPKALGNKIIHPFGDFLLHDVGTGDGILQNGPPETANKVRTPPLWGVRTRSRLMHDGSTSSRPTVPNNGEQSFTFNEAILRHAGEAAGVITKYISLPPDDKRLLITFLKSL